MSAFLCRKWNPDFKHCHYIITEHFESIKCQVNVTKFRMIPVLQHGFEHTVLLDLWLSNFHNSSLKPCILRTYETKRNKL
ncbi:unnamed protein product [Caretta caretta]